MRVVLPARLWLANLPESHSVFALLYFFRVLFFKMWKLKMASKVMGGPKNPLDNKELKTARYVRYGGFFVAGGAFPCAVWHLPHNVQHSLCWVLSEYSLLLFGLDSIPSQLGCQL